jgi:hypothetical protein
MGEGAASRGFEIPLRRRVSHQSTDEREARALRRDVVPSRARLEGSSGISTAAYRDDVLDAHRNLGQGGAHRERSLLRLLQ